MPIKANHKKDVRHRFKPKYLFLAIGLVLAGAGFDTGSTISLGLDCHDLEIIFARGSGEKLGASNYQAFRNSLAPKLAGLSYTFYELGSSSWDGARYPASPIGMANAETVFAAIGAKLSGGEAFSFGASVSQGVSELKSKISATLASCPNTKFVLAGYSQGAMVMSKAIKSIEPSHIIYVANFGDPKLYLPEGYGKDPIACSDPDSLSPYRIYAPDCRTYEGILGAYKPYQPSDAYSGKLGIWCNYHDIMCSSRIDWGNLMGAHTSYASDGRYVEATDLIASKIKAALGLPVEPVKSSKQDVAILIDSTGSMASLIENYKSEASRLASKVLLAGGRVALYEYRDLADPFSPVLHCNFETCTLAKFNEELAGIRADGGGDTPESLLSASLAALNGQHWQAGATKSVVVLTDAGYRNPDRDGTTLSQVITRSHEIDPVHFYFILPESAVDEDVRTLATETGGRIFDSGEELSISTNYIADQPEEPLVFDYGAGTLVTTGHINYKLENGTLKLNFTTTAYRNLLIINDNPYGFVEGNSLEISDLDFCDSIRILLIPYSVDGTRGEASELHLPASQLYFCSVPTVPATGKNH